MDFDWTTFVLEIINFLILVWILKRFLYQPVLGVIARRRAGIEKILADAKQIEIEASELKRKNERYLAEWEAEKEVEQAKLSAELATLRENKLAQLEVHLNEEAARRRVLDERNRKDFERLCEEKGIAQGVTFTSKLLTRLASKELEQQLFSVLIEDLQNIREQDRHAVIEAAAEPGLYVKVQSAFVLGNEQQEVLSHLLNEITGRTLPIEFLVHSELISGLQIDIGPWILHANLRDELKVFSGVLRHAK